MTTKDTNEEKASVFFRAFRAFRGSFPSELLTNSAGGTIAWRDWGKAHSDPVFAVECRRWNRIFPVEYRGDVLAIGRAAV